MFCVIYEFDVIAGKEAEFQQLWHEVTLIIRSEFGGLGSRLHKIRDNETKWLAYAQWPDRESWLNYNPSSNSTKITTLVKFMRSLCSSIITLRELDVTDDLLLKT